MRTIADNPETFRFASTGPYYVEIGAAPRRISKSSAQFFRDWVRERAGRLELEDPGRRQEVLRHHAVGGAVLGRPAGQGQRRVDRGATP